VRGSEYSTIINNLYLTDININGTGNYGIYFDEDSDNEPQGNISYCNIQYANIGNTSDMNQVPSGFTFEQSAGCTTLLNPINENEIMVWAHNGNIQLNNLPVGKTLAVYDITGITQYHAVIAKEAETIGHLRSGLYLICVDNIMITKVLINN
jgi:hypothetical protein